MLIAKTGCMRKNLKQLKREWKKLIGENRNLSLFASMDQHLADDSYLKDDYLSLKSRYNSLEHDYRIKGVVTTEDAKIEYSRIRIGFLELIEKVREEDLGDGISADGLDALISQLQIDIDLTPMYLVNCDRDDPMRSFRRAYRKYQGVQRKYQFYFITACPRQEPDGFAERIVYELIQNYADDSHKGIFYPRRGSERLAIDPLPLGWTEQECRTAFKTKFAALFPLGETDFETYLRTGLPRLRYDYITSAFRVTVNNWDSEIMNDYLNWLLDIFGNAIPGVPNFMFFIVVLIPKVHQPAEMKPINKAILDEIRQLVEKHQDRATLIENLEPVPYSDLDLWFENLGSNITMAQKEPIIEALIKNFSKEELDQWLHQKKLDMERIQNLQQKIYDSQK